VGELSGGERLRAALACEAVEAALSGYDGALLVVSHDRDFLAAIGIERRSSRL